MNAARKPAPAAPTSAHRRSMLAKVHIAPKQLGMSDDDYRAVLLRVAGKTSASECTDDQLDLVLKDFARRGFSAKARPKGARPADHPSALKARALWISLHQLGAIADPSERALEAMAARMLGTRLQWANQAHAYKLIEALKAIGARHGWNASLEGVRADAASVVLQRRLLDAIVRKLKNRDHVPDDWGVVRTVYQLTGIDLPGTMLAGAEELTRAAQALGAKLRELEA